MSQMVAALRVSAILAMCGLAGAAVQSAAQTPDVPLKDFESSMLEIGDAFEVIDEMTPSPAYLLNSVRGDSLARVDLALRQMNTVRKFFGDRSKGDGVELTDSAIVAIEVFRTELTRTSPDQAAAMEALEEVTRACAACHDVYRAGDKTVGFHFKPGVL